MIDLRTLRVGQIIVYVREPTSRQDVGGQYLVGLRCGELLQVREILVSHGPQIAYRILVESCREPGSKFTFAGCAAQRLFSPYVRFEDLPVPDFY